MTSRRVSLPVALAIPQQFPSPKLSPTSPSSPASNRRSCPTSTVSRRSLPSTPRTVSPRRVNNNLLPDVDEHFASTSSSSENSPRRVKKRRPPPPRYQYSLQIAPTNPNNMGNGADEDVDGDAKQPEGSIRSFAIKNGHVSDNGYQQMKHVVQPAIRNHGYRDRRATCPEVCLFPENPLRHVVLRVYGSKNCGKKTLLNSIDQFATKLESRYSNEPNEGDKNSSKIINFLLNSEQIELETLLESTLENCPFASSLTMYAIVYNVDSRESFLVASSLLSRLLMRKIARGTNIMLVGNKVDLKRNTVVSKLEGACLAKVHQCNFIQVSALYTMNISELWTLILRQVQANGSSDDEEQQQHGWMHKIVNRGRQLAHSAEQIVHKFVN